MKWLVKLWEWFKSLFSKAPDVVFDRVPVFDEESKDYPIGPVIEDAEGLISTMWDNLVYLDQGSEGACVGFAWAHDLAGQPYAWDGVDFTYALQIYNEAKKIDEWEGENYEGTSVLAGAKVCKSNGWIQEYRWAFNFADLLKALSHYGPAILGIPWYEGMMNPDKHGMIAPTGKMVGGHAILATGVDVANQTVRLHNSWGPSWGDGGNAYIHWEDLAWLLLQEGEACIPVKPLVTGTIH